MTGNALAAAELGRLIAGFPHPIHDPNKLHHVAAICQANAYANQFHSFAIASANDSALEPVGEAGILEAMTSGQRGAGHFLNAMGTLAACLWVLCSIPALVDLCLSGFDSRWARHAGDPKLWLFAGFVLGGAPVAAGLMVCGDFLRGQFQDTRSGMIERRILLEWAARACVLLAAATLLGGFWSGVVHAGRFARDWLLGGTGAGFVWLAAWCARAMGTMRDAADRRQQAARPAPAPPRKLLAVLLLLAAALSGLVLIPSGCQPIQAATALLLAVTVIGLFVAKGAPR